MFVDPLREGEGCLSYTMLQYFSVWNVITIEVTGGFFYFLVVVVTSQLGHSWDGMGKSYAEVTCELEKY